MNRSFLRLGFLLNALTLAFAWLAPWQLANAQCPQICDDFTANTAFGLSALPGDTGSGNTAIGDSALFSNTTDGNNDTATGFAALEFNTTGADNTATGASALGNNTTGTENTATGNAALFNNTTAIRNTATGAFALFFNTTGTQNTATGDNALFNNTTGFDNTATGSFALYNNKTGSFNTAVGFEALRHNPAGSNNIALGYQAGFNLNGANNIDIGNKGASGEAGTIRIGTAGTQMNAYVAGISGATVPTGVAVIVDSSGHLGTTTSSARFKEAIQPMDKSSEAILALKPVTFRYKKETDPEGIPQFGLVAEEVEKIDPDLVARDEQGKLYTVRYEAVNAMLLNEFLKEHRTVQELKSTSAKQEATIAKQQKQIEGLTSGLQKVTAEVEASRRAKQTVVSNP